MGLNDMLGDECSVECEAVITSHFLCLHVHCCLPIFNRLDHHASQGIPSLKHTPKSPPLKLLASGPPPVPGTTHSPHTTWDGVSLAGQVVSDLVPILGPSAKQKQRQTRDLLGITPVKNKGERGQEEAGAPSDDHTGLALMKGEGEGRKTG